MLGRRLTIFTMPDDSPYLFLSESAMEEFPEFQHDKAASDQHHTAYDSVVVGLAPDLFTYDRLTTAFRILISGKSSGDPGKPTGESDWRPHTPPFITTHRAKYIRTPDGALSLGPGPFVAALEDAVGPEIRK